MNCNCFRLGGKFSPGLIFFSFVGKVVLTVSGGVIMGVTRVEKVEGNKIFKNFVFV